jgi:hypothetical protein
MVVNKLQNGPLNSREAPRASRLNCQKKIFQMRTHTFFGNSDKDFYCEKNNVLQVYTYVLTYNDSLQPLILCTGLF